MSRPDRRQLLPPRYRAGFLADMGDYILARRKGSFHVFRMSIGGTVIFKAEVDPHRPLGYYTWMPAGVHEFIVTYQQLTRD